MHTDFDTDFFGAAVIDSTGAVHGENMRFRTFRLVLVLVGTLASANAQWLTGRGTFAGNAACDPRSVCRTTRAPNIEPMVTRFMKTGKKQAAVDIYLRRA